MNDTHIVAHMLQPMICLRGGRLKMIAGTTRKAECVVQLIDAQPKETGPMTMESYQVTFPNHYTLQLPANTIAAIEHARAKYAEPLWQFRAERVLKLGAHQWIYPGDVAAARALFALHPTGIIATAWKLFNRGWLAYAEAYFLDTQTYPNHPRHFGKDVIPLVDEDNQSQQIGWVRIHQSTTMDHNFTVFVQFTLLDLFEHRPLPAEYA